MRLLLNNPAPLPGQPKAHAGADPRIFHRMLPGYAPTPLIDAPAIASQLGVDRVWVKDESSRIGLPSYKILGASWATYATLVERTGATLGTDLHELAERTATADITGLVAATDGNHGRAVARMARLLRLDAEIYVPDDMVAARIASIEGEGARVTVVAGTYDDAVRRSADAADERRVVISDTSWEGYTDVPRRVTDGYATIFAEIDAQLAEVQAKPVSLVAVQIGVGALATATVKHYRREMDSEQAGVVPTILGVEPTRAACVLAAVGAGRVVELPGPHDSIMSGLNCGLASPTALPWLMTGINAFAAVTDDDARQAMRLLADAGVESGESGAAGLAGLLGISAHAHSDALRRLVGLTSDARVLVLSTEGATDPGAYEQITGRSPKGQS